MNKSSILALASLFLTLPATIAAQSQDSVAGKDTSQPAISSSAQRVYLDPQTGRLTNEPPVGASVLTLSPAELNMLSTSDRGLVEKTLPDGGVMLDLQGRFRSVAVATVGEDGTIEIRDVAGEVFLPAEEKVADTSDGNEP